MGVNLDRESLERKGREAEKKFVEKKINAGLSGVRFKIAKIMRDRGIKKAGIFGSYARGEQKKSSDVDILIEPTAEMGFFDIVKLEDELEDSLKKKVDLLTYASVHRLLRERILREEIRIV